MNKHLFILTPSNCGSSCMSLRFNACTNIVSFPTYACEGILLHGNREFGFTNQPRLFRKYDINIPIMKETFYKNWKKSKKYKRENKILFDKSALCTMFYGQEIEQAFENSHFIIMIRHPIPFAEGMRRRDVHENESKNLQSFEAKSFRELVNSTEFTLTNYCKYWVECAKQQIENCEKLKKNILITYEHMCNNPNSGIKNVKNLIDGVDDFRLDTKLEVGAIGRPSKNAVKLTNYNQAQIKALTAEEIQECNDYLCNHMDVLKYFDYELIH